MNPYMFVIKAVPLANNENYDTIAGAFVHVCVVGSNINSAEHKALDYISNLLWNPVKIEHAFEMSQEQIDALDAPEAQLYQKSLHLGIAAYFVAYPKEDGNPDDPIMIGRP